MFAACYRALFERNVRGFQAKNYLLKNGSKTLYLLSVILLSSPNSSLHREHFERTILDTRLRDAALLTLCQF
jgi:hypothetical protein